MSLVNRLKKIQVPDESPLEEMNKYSMEQLESMKVDFGATHKGKSYLEVWTHHQAWIKWFTEHFHSSSKLEHRKMLRFIELKVEHRELEGTTIPLTDGRQKVEPEKSEILMAQSKKKAQRKSSVDPPCLPISVSEETEPWEEIHAMDYMEKEQQETREEVQVMQSRIF